MLNHLDLFSGIGGFALAASWTGKIQTVGFSEIDPYAIAVLKKNFPNTPNYGDIRQITRETLGQRIDLITGGFPCQPFSVAGKQLGKADHRDLWPEMLRVIKEFKPSWVIGENVAGFVNMELDRTVTDLEAQGYEVQPLIIPACAVGAPHRRDRVWIIAYSQHNGQPTAEVTRSPAQGDDSNPPRQDTVEQSSGCASQQPTTDTSCSGFQRDKCTRAYEKREATYGSITECLILSQWQEPWPEAATRLCGVDDGVSARVDRIKCLGNAIVPQVAYEILNKIQTLTGETNLWI